MQLNVSVLWKMAFGHLLHHCALQGLYSAFERSVKQGQQGLVGVYTISCVCEEHFSPREGDGSGGPVEEIGNLFGTLELRSTRYLWILAAGNLWNLAIGNLWVQPCNDVQLQALNGI